MLRTINVLTGEETISAEPSRASVPLERAKAAVAAAVRAEGKRRLDLLSADYTDAEKHTWPQQAAEAEAYGADPLAPTPLLSGMAAARGITRGEMVQRVDAARAAFVAAAGPVLGRQQKLEADAWAAADHAALEAVDPLDPDNWP